MYQNIRLNVDEKIATLTIDRPSVKNALNRETVDEIHSALRTLAAEESAGVLIVTGAGESAFVSGADINDIRARGREDGLAAINSSLFAAIERFPRPTIAAINGYALGGGFELALACDFVFAERTAVFGLPEIALGVFPPAASALLPARVGLARATSAILTGATRPADDWYRAGLVEQISEPGAIATDVDRWFAQHLRDRSAAALRHTTAAVRLALRQHVGAALPELERLYLAELMGTADAAEGIAAFLAKRTPRWRDR
jgi:cyclohexa-1,5-dienecarbonyl-CoA hydratase